MFEAMAELIFEVRGGGPCDPTAPRTPRRQTRTVAPPSAHVHLGYLSRLFRQVHLGTFSGGAEKCVDIALAVEMLHYATEPNALDVAGAHLPY